jgi:NADPH2:quinone reductase
MKAICAREWCEPQGLELIEVDTPKAKKGDVLIKVGSAALNFPDILMIQGKYQVKPPLPFTPGMEVAGTIEEVGEGVEHLKVGDRVMAQTGMGGFAEYASAPAIGARKLPEGMTDDEGAGFWLVYSTSYFALAYRAQMKPGETVLVHSAAGGVGMAAVQIAKALGADKIIGTVGSDEKLDVIRELGVDVAINYETEDWVGIVKKETGGRGVDIIYDPVGGKVGELSTKCIAFEGRLLVIGFTSGEFPTYKANHILIKNYSVVGLHWGNYRTFKPELLEQSWVELARLFTEGKVKPLISARYPMADVAKAMEHLRSRKAVGKIVLNW